MSAEIRLERSNRRVGHVVFIWAISSIALSITFYAAVGVVVCSFIMGYEIDHNKKLVKEVLNEKDSNGNP